MKTHTNTINIIKCTEIHKIQLICTLDFGKCKYIHAGHNMQFYLNRPVNRLYNTFIIGYRINSHVLNIESGRYIVFTTLCDNLCHVDLYILLPTLSKIYFTCLLTTTHR
jgi:hypothetical protein